MKPHLKSIQSVIKFFSGLLIISNALVSCSSNKSEQKEEQIRITEAPDSIYSDSLNNSVNGNVAINLLSTTPNSVILTGLPEHRLVTIYKTKVVKTSSGKKYIASYGSSESYYVGEDDEEDSHFMPGIDIIYGYNLLNIAHYDLQTEKLNYFFDHPALVKTLYYPCFEQDSLDNKPITRNYYLVSVYDEDTNHDTLINNKDLRRFYHFDASCTSKTQIVPKDYSAIRSEYDSKNDVMYLFARKDVNNNGTGDYDEPIHIFWLNLKSPAPAKQLY
ncbi:MAG: hypothetical protein ABI772_11000 [Bacteroidota bacterium]